MLRRWLIVSIGTLGSLALLWHLARNGSELYFEHLQLQQVEQRVSTLKEKIAALENERDRLKIDDTYIESIARDDLGMVKPGEIVYYFPATP